MKHWDKEDVVEIGEPQRTIIVEPVEDPIPAREPVEVPERERELEPA